MNRLDLVRLFLAIFGISSLAGLAALLRSGRDLTLRSVASSLLNSGLLGTAIGMFWYHYYPANIVFVFVVSILAGLGGMSLLDFLLMVIRKGLKVSITVEEEDKA